MLAFLEVVTASDAISIRTAHCRAPTEQVQAYATHFRYETRTALDAAHGNQAFKGLLSDQNTPHDIISATSAWFRD